MTARKPLRVVVEGDKPEPSKKKPTVLEAAESGDYLAELLALRRRIATAVTDPNTPARDLAALTRRQLEISKEINAIKSASEESDGDADSDPGEAWDESAI